ncbi:unannotated protein [freshwater metagenome]|uniref:Unannotated protein n=1 Tax=freshwater metagenome TaxID=449393 RepID=A0A6J7JML0_9ZZZZ|nr:hypothetical protein [Actinomycetota bacterium]MSW36851.1 hypothetical protein [Actinomycetota bacterium]
MAHTPVPRSSSKATVILVLGIAALVLCGAYGVGLVCAIVALAMAPGARREIAGSRGSLSGTGMIQAGVICSWVAIGLTIVAAAVVVVALLVSKNPPMMGT